nr:MAG TPA: hypothetical protein [Caudoviricetes sp.]
MLLVLLFLLLSLRLRLIRKIIILLLKQTSL